MYYSFVIHIVWKVLSDDRIEPPIHAKNFLSSGENILILVSIGANLVNSLLSLSANPGNTVVPPERTMFLYRSSLISLSHRIIDLCKI